jgi:hypothetical protein
MNRDELEQSDLEVAVSSVLADLLQLLLPRPAYACSASPHGYRPSIDDPHTPRFPTAVKPKPGWPAAPRAGSFGSGCGAWIGPGRSRGRAS